MSPVRIVSAHGCHPNTYRMVPPGVSLGLVALPSCNLPSEMAEVLYSPVAYEALQRQHTITTLRHGDVYPDLMLRFEHGVVAATPQGVFEEDVYGTSAELFRMRQMNDRIRAKALNAFQTKYNRRPVRTAVLHLSDVLSALGAGHYIVATCRRPCRHVADADRVLMQVIDAEFPTAWPRSLQEPVNASALRSHGLGRPTTADEAVIDPEGTSANTKALISRLLEGIVPSRTRTQKRLREDGHYVIDSKYVRL